MDYAQREAIAAVANIENAILQLEIFKGKAQAAIPVNWNLPAPFRQRKWHKRRYAQKTNG